MPSEAFVVKKGGWNQWWLRNTGEKSEMMDGGGHREKAVDEGV